MNLLIAASNTGCNGAVMYARRLVSLLKSRGHHVWLAARKDSWIAQETQGEVPLFSTDFSRWPLTEVDRVGAFCRQEGIQIFHSHLTRASNFGALLRWRKGIRSIAHLHANHPQLHTWFHDRVIAVSADTLKRHRRYLAGVGRRGAVLTNFVDTQVFYPANGRMDKLRTQLQLAPAVPVAVVLGTICERKGQDLAIQAWPEVRRIFPEACLALIGQGTLPSRFSNTQGVVLLGQREDIPDLLPHATLCLVPSRDEPFGLAAIEAMACGVPVVAPPVSGLADIISGGAGASYPPGDVPAMAKAIIRLLGEPQWRQELSSRGLARAQLDYSPTPHLVELEKHYAEVLDLA